MFSTAPLTEEQRITKAIVAISGNENFRAMASVMMVGNTEVHDDLQTFGWPEWAPVQTAMTNGKDVLFNRAFVASLSDAQLRFLILHENFHKMFRHLITWRHMHDIHPQAANFATDFYINLRIMDDAPDGFLELAPGALIDEQFRGMNSNEIFKKLMEDVKQQGGGDGQGQGGKGKRKFKVELGNGQGDGQMMDYHDWEAAQDLTEEEKRDLEREIDQAVRQGALMAGKTGSGGNRDIDELSLPQVRWQDQLRDFLVETCDGHDFSTWTRPNRRHMANDVYMPRNLSERPGEIVVAPDMSGSTYNMVGKFLTELKAIADQLKPERIRILYWDTQVTSDETFEMHELDQLIQTTQPKGGGGTTVTCVVDYMREHHIDPEAIVVLTDGYIFEGDWGGHWPAPVFWCICDNKGANPPFGRVVHIET